MGKKSKPPPPPDYTALAKQTADSANAAAQANTVANRPNQTDVYGNTSTWSQDPAGNWSQVQKLGAAGQQQLDQGNQLQSTLSGQAQDALGRPLTTEGLPEADLARVRAASGSFNMDPTGNSQAIQDATYKLLQPQRDQARAAEAQRLASQGLTPDSPAYQRAMTRLDQGDTSAQLQSLIAGQQEYGNAFNRGLAESGQNYNQISGAEQMAAALRGQGLNEREFLRQQPLNELEQVKRMNQAYNPAFGSFMGATAGQGTDYYGAGKDKYNADVAQVNAANASKSAMTGGLMTLAGTALGGPAGGAAAQLMSKALA
jgi:hypothetical protein